MLGILDMFMKATFLGHATVYLETSDTKILIDPFFTGNPHEPTFFAPEARSARAFQPRRDRADVPVLGRGRHAQ